MSAVFWVCDSEPRIHDALPRSTTCTASPRNARTFQGKGRLYCVWLKSWSRCVCHLEKPCSASQGNSWVTITCDLSIFVALYLWWLNSGALGLPPSNSCEQIVPISPHFCIPRCDPGCLRLTVVRAFTPGKLANASGQGVCACMCFFPESRFTNTGLCLYKNIFDTYFKTPSAKRTHQNSGEFWLMFLWSTPASSCRHLTIALCASGVILCKQLTFKMHIILSIICLFFIYSYLIILFFH